MQESIGSYQGKPIYAGTDANVSQQMFGGTPNVVQPQVQTQMSTQQLNADSGMQGTIPPTQIQQTPANIQQFSQAVDNSVKLKEAEFKQAQDQVAQQEAKIAPLNDMYLQLGMQSDEYNQNFQQGLNQQFQDLNQYKAKTQELQNKLNAFNTETDNAIRQQELMSLQGGAQTKGAQSTQNAVIIRERDIQANQIKAALAGATGQQALAQDAIDLYLKSKYDPYENKIKNLERYLDLNEKQLARKDSKALEAQRNLIDFQKTQLAAQRSDDEAKQKIMATAAEFGAPNSLLQQIGNAKNPMEAIQKATGYLSDPLDRKIKQAQLSKIYLDMEQTRKANALLSGQVPTPTGGSEAKGSLMQRTAGLKLTEAQSKALAFSTRAIDAEANLAQMIEQGYNPTTIGGNIGGTTFNDKAREFDRYMEEFARAVLRKESGATITEEEKEGAFKIYNPAGIMKNASDLKQTSGIRGTAIDTIIAEAGPASRFIQEYKSNVKPRGDVVQQETYQAPDGSTFVKGPDGKYYKK